MQLAATDALTDAAYGWEGVGRDVTQVNAHEMTAHEIGAACTLSPPAARARVELAHALRRLPLTRLALAAGRIDLAKARAIVEATLSCTDQAAAAIEARVLGRAGTQTVPMLRAALRRAVIAIEPSAAAARRERAVRERGVTRESLEDGMARLEWVGPVEEVEGTYTWLTAKAAQAVAAGGSVRTMDQARSDVLADLRRPRADPGGPADPAGPPPPDRGRGRLLHPDRRRRRARRPARHRPDHRRGRPPDPPKTSATPSSPGTRPAAAWAAGSRPTAATSTTASPTRTARPPSTTWTPAAAASTGSKPAPTPPSKPTNTAAT